MKSLILYSTWNHPDDRQRYTRHFIVDGKPLYIRVEPSDEDYSSAFDHANPRESETVLNSIPINPSTD